MTAHDRIDPRQYDAERAAKRAVIAARLREEKAAKAAAAFDARLLREARQQEDMLELRVHLARRKWDARLARGQMHYDGEGRLHCYHPGSPLYDECPACQQASRDEWAAEAAANA